MKLSAETMDRVIQFLSRELEAEAVVLIYVKDGKAGILSDQERPTVAILVRETLDNMQRTSVNN
jgi:hypothetical protein